MAPAAAFGRLKRLLRLRRREQVIVRVVAAVSALAAGLFVTGWALAASQPAWWTERESAQPPGGLSASEIATRLENAFITEATQARPQDPSQPGRSVSWAVLIRESDVNAWLEAKGPRWLASPAATSTLPGAQSAWQAKLAGARVRFAASGLTLGVRLRSGDSERILWVACTPVIRQGDLWLDAASLHIGRLQAPAGWLLDAPPQGAPASSGLLHALTGNGPLLAPPRARLHDGRHVRLLDVRVEDAALVLTCTTESAGL